MHSLSESNHRRPAVRLALFAVYLIWGTTFLATRFAIESMPPLLMIAVRYLTAGLLLYTIARFMYRKRPTWSEWKGAAVLGISVMGICNGIVALVADRVPTGSIACIFATGPFVLSIVSWIGGSGQQPGRREILSMIAGFAGVFLLTGLGAESSDSSNWIFTMFLMLATLSWAIGTVWTKKREDNTPIALVSSMQMIWGGGFSLVLSLLRGEWTDFSPSTVSASAASALFYLIVFGTIVAFISYNYLLKSTSDSVVASHAYVNPLVAMIAGVLVLGERFTVVEGVSALLIVSAVFISLGKARRRENPVNRFQTFRYLRRLARIG